MNYHVMTLFPEMIEQGLSTSIIGRAIEKGFISFEAINIRDYSGDLNTTRWMITPMAAEQACLCRLSLYMTVIKQLKKK